MPIWSFLLLSLWLVAAQAMSKSQIASLRFAAKGLRGLPEMEADLLQERSRRYVLSRL